MGTTAAVVVWIALAIVGGTSLVVYRRPVARWYRDFYTRTLGGPKSRMARRFTPSTVAFVGTCWALMGVFLGLNYFVWSR